LDTLTDLAARYLTLLAQSTAIHASINQTELDITVQDVRMAMQDCGALLPERVLEEQEFDQEEDMRGIEGFLSWAVGEGNREIRRIALEGDGSKDDYLTVLKKKHSTTDEDSRYHGTLLGKAAEPRIVKVEGGEISSVKEWADRLRTSSKATPTPMLSSRAQSSALSSVGDQVMDDMDF